ncbi:MAG: hypothetical protein WCJ21_09330, partial [Planctomycetota bacterium]
MLSLSRPSGTPAVSDIPFDPAEWQALLAGHHGQPGRILGPETVARDPRTGTRTQRVRAFLPQAKRAWIVQQMASGRRTSHPMRRMHRSGIYEGLLTTTDGSADERTPPYVLRVDDATSGQHDLYDPYA